MSPIFSPELFSYIIDNIGQRDFGESYGRLQLPTLRACALSCRLFALLCQPYIFKHVDLGGKVALMHGRTDAQLLNIVNAIEHNPQLSSHIEELCINMAQLRQIEFSEHNFKRCQKVLVSFSKLQLLALYCRDDEEAQGEEQSSLWDDVFDAIATIYAGQSTMRAIHLHCFDNLPWPTVFANPAIQHIESENSTISDIDTPYPTSNIITLKVANESDFPTSIFLALPQLEILHLCGIPSLVDTAEDTRTASCNLKEFSLLNMGPCLMGSIMELFLTQPDQDSRPFRNLTTLHIGVFQEDEGKALCRVLDQIVSLQTLGVTAITSVSSDNYHFDLMNLVKVLASCTTFSLHLTHLPLTSGIDDKSVGEITSCLAAIAIHNVLQTFTLTLLTAPPCSHSLFQERFAELSAMLADPHQFPLLKGVKVSIFLLDPEGAGWGGITYKDMGQLMRELECAMRDLEDRKTVKLEISVE